jgi:His/Glu/Gln/Arg/opine family amino acid ABC transporter permease subunit
VIAFATAYFPLYLEGTLVGLFLTTVAMAGSFVIGLAVALGRLSRRRLLRHLSGTYVAFFRGIPPLVLLYIVYFGLPSFAQELGNPALIALLAPLDNRLLAATVAFAINSGAYSAEIIRAGIVAIHADQLEAARSIGMSYAVAMRRIILPQALRVAFPPLGNEFITVLKGTSLASVIGVTELMRSAQLAASTTFENMWAYSFAAIFYVCVVILLQGLIYLLEFWFTPVRRRHLLVRLRALSRPDLSESAAQTTRAQVLPGDRPSNRQKGVRRDA